MQSATIMSMDMAMVAKALNGHKKSGEKPAEHRRSGDKSPRATSAMPTTKPVSSAIAIPPKKNFAYSPVDIADLTEEDPKGFEYWKEQFCAINDSTPSPHSFKSLR